MDKTHTPFDAIVAALGSVEAVADVCRRHRTTLYYWNRASADRLAGDLPSTEIMRRLLAHARAHGIPLTAEHLIYGASADELARLAAHAARAKTPGQVAA
jgi:hypothetical protein